MDETELLFAVMYAYPWSAVMVDGSRLNIDPDSGEPTRFIPVFDTQEAALAWAGDGKEIAAFKEVDRG